MTGLPDLPPYDRSIWKPVTRLLFRCIIPAGLSGLFVALFDSGGHLLAFVGPFAGVTVLQECLLWLFGHARRMGATQYEILRKD